MRRVLLPLLSTALAAVLGTVLAAPAWAHTRLVSSTPAAGVAVEAPAQVVLVFSDPVRPGLSAVSVTGADGGELVAGSPTRGDGPATVSQALRSPLPPGTYRVAYRVLASDGHPVTGSFDITATTTPATPTASAPAPSAQGPTTGPLQPAAGERDDGGLPGPALLVGGLFVAGTAGLLARRLGGGPPGA